MASTMVSPSRLTTSRTVPCIAGCDGPRFTVIRLEGRSDSSASGSSWCSVIGRRVHVLAPDVRLAHRDAGAARARARAANEIGEFQLGDERLPLAGRIVLAQGVALELGVHEDALQVRVADELDPEHVEYVALPPIGGPPHGGDGGDLHVVGAQLDAQAQALLADHAIEVVGELEARLARGLLREVVH